MKTPKKQTKNAPSRRPSAPGYAAMCDWHELVEEYYGHRCSTCGVFYSNTAPLEAWMNGIEYDLERDGPFAD